MKIELTTSELYEFVEFQLNKIEIAKFKEKLINDVKKRLDIHQTHLKINFSKQSYISIESAITECNNIINIIKQL